MIEASLSSDEVKVIEESVLALTLDCFYEYYDYFETELKYIQQDYVNVSKNFPLQCRENILIQPEYRAALTFFAVMFDLEDVPELCGQYFTVSPEDIDRLWDKLG